MTEQEQKRLMNARRQYLLRINDTPVVILVDDRDGEIIAGCFEAIPGDSFDVLSGKIPISLKPIEEETVLGYAHLMLTGILEQIKKEFTKGNEQMV